MSYPAQVLTGSAEYATGRPGWWPQCARFDGTWNAGFALPPPFQGGSGTHNHNPWSVRIVCLCSAGQHGVPVGNGNMDFFITSATEIQGNPPALAATIGVTPEDGNWHEYLYCYDGTTGYLFMDGSLVAHTTADIGTFDLSTLVFGSNGTTLTTATFTGLLQEVSFWSTCLHTSTYTAQLHPTDPINDPAAGNLVAVYYFNGTLGDSSGQQLPLGAGALMIGGRATTLLLLTYTSAYGGIPPYTTQLYRSTVSGFTPGPSTLIATNPTFPYTDSGLTPGTAYYYVVEVTDSTIPTAGTALSNQVMGQPVDLPPGTFLTSHPYVHYSPANWYQSPGFYALTNNSGAYLDVVFYGSGLSLGVDVSGLDAISASASDYPTFSTIVDDVGMNVANFVQVVQLVAGQTEVTLISGLLPSWHTAHVCLSRLEHDLDYSIVPSCALKITSNILDSDGDLQPYTPLAKIFLFAGDSITVGSAAGDTSPTTGGMNSTYAYTYALAGFYGAEFGVIAYPGAGWVSPVGGSNVPIFHAATPIGYWDSQFLGQPRVFPPTADKIFMMVGSNFGMNVGQLFSWMEAVRARFPSAQLVIAIPANALGAGAIQTDYAAYAAAFPGDTNIALINLIGLYDRSKLQVMELDDIHPSAPGHAILALALGQFGYTNPAVQVTVVRGTARGLQ